MSRTGSAILTAFSRFIGDYWTGTTTSAGNAGFTTLVDTALRRFGDDTLRDFYLRPTGASNPYAIRRITSNAAATGTVTVTPAFAAQCATTETYEIHRYDPAEKFTCIDEARLRVFDDLARTIYDDTTTADGISRVFPVPSTMRKGPLFVQEECPLSVDVFWNFLADPRGDDTTDYTATGTTATTVNRTDADPIVPKLEQTCTKLVTAASQAATYNLLIASAANSLTAALAADREMAHARWVYCTEASKVRLGITDDSGATYGSYHGGNGWELLTAEDTIVGNNATTLTAVLDIASTANASTIYAERGWWYFGAAERVRDGVYYGSIPKRVRRDDTTQQVYLDWIPERGYQLRFIGRETLSALGTVAASQVTNTMEVDEENEQILYAEAAKILFTRLGLNLSDFSEVAANIALAEGLKRETTKAWKQTVQKPPIKMWIS